jgi:hypothetical protein
MVCFAKMIPGIPGLPCCNPCFGTMAAAGGRSGWRAAGRTGWVLLLLAAATVPTAVAASLPAGAAEPLNAPPPPPGPVGSLVVELAKQRITAFDRNHQMLYRQLVSTGLAASPTPKGDFHVKAKYKKTKMTGRDYQIPVVENVMCLGGDGLPSDSICVHPAPWQEAAGQTFGVRRSHGCIRTSSATARWLFGHTDVGTPVTIQN